MSIIAFHGPSPVDSIVPDPMLPAALTSVVSRPKRVRAAVTIRSGASIAVTSTTTSIAVPPSRSITARASCSVLAVRPTSTTAAPVLANAAAAARPMPLEAPVTTTTWSSAIGHPVGVGFHAFDEHEAVAFGEGADGAEVLILQRAGGAPFRQVRRILCAPRDERAEPAALRRLD